ncbi:Carboxysome shell and ethanolamine utilization microcompartment protein CcmL/EutN [Tindallia magadiensis]|uniref:Carboxysome shell and ethanolamine utilization microcompartment protein CcmL/EutN n=1 Tax=Tindallia magadiensis TaxID=69895 RepID=A0A1I3BWD6_9FIRM|nr:BMC domain-containing protein [Tindallia magadiensis]SFH66051.1 Carboxysome shell and ethanolamine utilization microcompartment protein CcmL/EutN [Tindallia magadiensis]
MKTSMGLLETYGALGAYVGADAALKAASVTLVSKNCPSGGLVTLSFEGDVGAIKAAIEAGEAAVKNLGISVTSHVIPRITPEVGAMLVIEEKQPLKEEPEAKEPEKEKSEAKEPEKEEIETPAPEESKEITQETTYVSLKGENYAVFEKGGIDELKVASLREIARKLGITPADGRRIQNASKYQLVNAIRHHMKGGEHGDS